MKKKGDIKKDPSVPYTGEPSMSARHRVAGKIDIGSGQVGNIPIDSTSACFSICTPGHCDCICECDSICGPCDCACACDCDCAACACDCDCDCDSDIRDMWIQFSNQIAAIEKHLSVLTYQVGKLGDQMNMIATQGVVSGRRGAAISNRLTNIESIVTSHFGDIEGILSKIGETKKT